MSIIILGSTGSVGKQAIEVACAHNLKVSALSCGSNVKLLEHQARMLGVRACSVRDPEAAKALRLSLADTSIKVYDGDDGLCEMIAELRASKVLNAVSGFSGLRPTLAAIDAGSDVALANKESLVVAGKLVMARAKDAGVKILPVDSGARADAVYDPSTSRFKAHTHRVGGRFRQNTRRNGKCYARAGARPSDMERWARA